MKDELADVDFVVDQVVTSPAQIEAMKDELARRRRHPGDSPEHRDLVRSSPRS